MARYSMLLVFFGLVAMVIVVYRFYGRIFESNVSIENGHRIVYIPTGSTYDAVVDKLETEGIIENSRSFRWVARKKGYDRAVMPGRYKVANGLSNNSLINMLRSGDQDPVMVVFHHVRTLANLAGKAAPYLETDSASLAAYLTDPALPGEFGFDPRTFPSMFVPNTYEFFWTTTPAEFASRMKREYDRFWEGERDRRAKKLGMSRTEISTLASIVDEETLFDEENKRVAGVYMNRLKRGIPLQADPTLRFALGDFTIKRILNEDKQIDSPYNTYKYRGLPPGPISVPSIAAIDGVLQYEEHDYLYFCARADFSGYHAFATTLAQHNRNAGAYQRALNRSRIYR